MSQVRRASVLLIAAITAAVGFMPAASATAHGVASARGVRNAVSTVARAASVATNAVSPGPGYWLVARDGGVFANGAADFHGSTGAIALNQPIVGIAATPTGNGYWMVASDGGIFSFGDAAFHGSTGAIALNRPIVGLASTPSGHGYWLVASDGGIFSFGDAHFFGSTGAMALNQPIVGMAATPTGHGYTLVASDGGIFSFGNAAFHGSAGALTLRQPIVGIASTPTGAGYWMVARDGGIFSFGDAAFHGSTGATALNLPIVGMAATPTGNGYWFVAADGGIFSFGDAHFFGAARPQGLDQAIVGMAASAPRRAAVVVPTATQLNVTTDPSPTTGGVVFATQPVVNILDANGSIVASATNAVTLSIASAPAGVVLTCDRNPVHAVAGIATFVGCSINRAGHYTLRARSGSLTPSSSFATVTVGPAARIAFLQQPSSSASLAAFATQPEVAIQDLGGNTLISVNTGNVVLSITTPNTPGGALTCTSTTTGYSSGVATFSGCHIDVSGTYRLHAIDASFNTNSAPLAITAAGAHHLAFTTQPSPTGSTGGSVFPVQPVVTVQDAANNTVTGDNSSVTLAITQASDPAGAVIACDPSTAETVVAGVATFASCRINLASTTTYTLTATDGALIAGTSNTLDIDVGAATHIGFVTQPNNSTGGVAFPQQPRVAVQDAGGNTVTTATGNITLTITQPSAPVGAALTCTTSNVRALVAGVTPAFTGCAIDLPSSTFYRLQANDDAGGAFGIQSGPVVITVGPAARLGFVTQPSASTGGIAFPTQPRVAVQDAGGNTVTTATGNVTLTITQPSAPVGAALTCTTSTVRTLVAGLTPAFTGCAIDRRSTGTYTLLATDDAVGGFVGTSSAFAITVGPAAKLGFVTQPSNSTGGAPFATQPHVAIQDAGGNTVVSDTSVVTLEITRPSDPTSATLSCTTANTRTPAVGVASFAGCKIDLASTGAYTLVATVATGLTSATSSAFAIAVGAVARIAFSTQPSPNAGVDVLFAQQPVVTLHDAGGNVVTIGSRDVTLTISQPSEPAEALLTCSNTTPLPTVAGTASFTDCAIDLAGTYTLQADTTGFTVTSAELTIT